jgi:hypothetical protein
MQIDVNDLPEEIADLGQQARFEDVVILKNGQPWLKIVKHDAYRPKVRPGLFPDLFGDGYELPDDFCETPDEIIDDFYK